METSGGIYPGSIGPLLGGNVIYPGRPGPYGSLAGAVCPNGKTLATAWAAQVVTNGGAAPGATYKNAVGKFKCGLIADGIDSTMILYNLMSPANLIASQTPQVVGNSAVLWPNHNFVSGDLTVNGLKGDGSTKFLETASTGVNIVGSATTQQSLCTWVMTSVAGSSANGRDFGVLSGTFDLVTGTDSIPDSYGASGGNPSNVITTGGHGAGFYADLRVTAADHRLFFANNTTAITQIGSTDTNSFVGGLPTDQHYVFALNNSGSAFGLNNSRICACGIATGAIGSAGLQKLYNRLNAYVKAVGGTPA